MSESGISNSSRKNRNTKNLKLGESLAVNDNPGPSSGFRDGQNESGTSNCQSISSKKMRSGDIYPDLFEKLQNLEIGVELRLDIKQEDLQMVKELGAGNGGTVSKVFHVPTKTYMAKKVIHVEPSVQKQILRELDVLQQCHSPHIVSFYGAFLSGNELALCLEYMDLGSLDGIYKKNGPISMPILGVITTSVLSGLTYLYEYYKIIHRDVKPSNILVNSAGSFKLCDFGVSGEAINSVVMTFVGTSQYMSPERIQGGQYTVKSDVWSLGLTLIELATGQFPFPPDGTRLSVFELLQFIVNESPPTLPVGKFEGAFNNLVQKCLEKDPSKRPTPKLLMSHPFVVKAVETRDQVNVVEWTKTLLS